MRKIDALKTARKLAYNVFEKTGNIADYGKYKSLDEMVKAQEKDLSMEEFGMQ